MATSTKPALSNRVDYTPMGGSGTFNIPFANIAKAIKEAVGQIKQGSTNVTIWTHDGSNWVKNDGALRKALDQFHAQNGNSQAIANLTTLSEYTLLLQRQAKGKGTLVEGNVRTWLDMVFQSAKVLNVPQEVIVQSLQKVFAREQVKA